MLLLSTKTNRVFGEHLFLYPVYSECLCDWIKIGQEQRAEVVVRSLFYVFSIYYYYISVVVYRLLFVTDIFSVVKQESVIFSVFQHCSCTRRVYQFVMWFKSFQLVVKFSLKLLILFKLVWRYWNGLECIDYWTCHKF